MTLQERPKLNAALNVQRKSQIASLHGQMMIDYENEKIKRQFKRPLDQFVKIKNWK